MVISQARTRKHAAMVLHMKTNEIYQANYDFTKAKSAYVFKTIVDPFLGKYSLIKVCSGVIKGDDTLYNTGKETEEKLNKLYVLEGSKPIEVSELHAGDIGAIAKLNTVTDRRYTFHQAIPLFCLEKQSSQCHIRINAIKQ